MIETCQGRTKCHSKFSNRYEADDSYSMSETDVVVFFGQAMTRDWADELAAEQLEPELHDADGSYTRIAYGHETFCDPVESHDTPCRHCSTIRGKLHFHSCDYEQCPKRNWEMMSCDCEFIGQEWRE